MKYIFIFFSLIFFLSGCTQRQEVNIEAEMLKVKEVVDKFALMMETENLKMFESIISKDEDMVNYGTDAAERWVGFTAFKDAIQKHFDGFENSKLTVSNQTIKVHSSGEVAWFTEIVDWNLVAGGTPLNLEGIRITGVLEKRNDKWVIVQFHGSVPVQGQVAEY